MKEKISVAQIEVHPYDRTSKLANDPADTSYFERRRDFVLLRNTSRLAVRITLFNNQYYNKTPRGANGQFAAVLVDTDADDAMVSAKTFAVRIHRSEPLAYVRVDMPMPYADIDASHAYRLEIRDSAGAVAGSMPVRFFDLPKIKMLPTKWYRAQTGAVNPEGPFGYTPMLTPGHTCPGSIAVAFTAESRLPEDATPFTPEVEIRLTFPDGTVTKHFVEPKQDSDGLFTAEAHFTLGHAAGVFYAELCCMRYAFAAFAFANTGEAVAGEWRGKRLCPAPRFTTANAETYLAGELAKVKAEATEAEKIAEAKKIAKVAKIAKDPQQSPDPLDSLVGLSAIKERLEQYTGLVRFNKLRERAGLPGMSLPLHSMFLGSPGTGKTTVAKILGERLRRIGVLSKGHVVVRDRATLCGQFYNSESEKTLQALEEARGGILFIDEAYQLYQPDDPRDPAKFVIESLLTALADESCRDWMLILAGYSEPMKRMFEMNPGLRSRIPVANIFFFEDFDEHELMEIARRHLAGRRFSLDAEAEQALAMRLSADYSRRGDDFGNARHVVNLIETDIIPAMAMRINAMDAPELDDLTVVRRADIPAPAPDIARPRERSRVGFAV